MFRKRLAEAEDELRVVGHQLRRPRRVPGQLDLDLTTEEVERRCATLAGQGRFLRASDPVDWPDGTVSAWDPSIGVHAPVTGASPIPQESFDVGKDVSLAQLRGEPLIHVRQRAGGDADRLRDGTGRREAGSAGRTVRRPPRSQPRGCRVMPTTRPPLVHHCDGALAFTFTT